MQVRGSDSLPRVSILINNYNYGQFLAAAIESALQQSYPHTEVVVVDDGSTDHSREIIASYGDVIVPVLKANGGQASAFNAGFAASQGDIICFLDADDLYLPEKVAAIVDVLKNYQESAWCFHPLEIVEATSKVPIASENNFSAVSVKVCDVRSDIRQGGKGLRQKLPFSLPASSGLCFTRSLLQQILPMPEAEGIAIGDSYVQFASVALAQGFAVPSKLALQRIHSNNFYTRNVNRKAATARIFCLTAFWMRTNFPFMAQFAHKFFAAGLSDYWHVNQTDSKTQEVIEKYFISLPPLERLKIRARSLYYYFTSNHVE
jgi:glycosyltransferase involved in cell wall biosynthesis